MRGLGIGVLFAVTCGGDAPSAGSGSSGGWGEPVGAAEDSPVNSDCTPVEAVGFGSLQPAASGGVHVVGTYLWEVRGECAGVLRECERREWSIDAGGLADVLEPDPSGYGYDVCDNGRWESPGGSVHLLFDGSLRTTPHANAEPVSAAVGSDVRWVALFDDAVVFTTWHGRVTRIAEDGSGTPEFGGEIDGSVQDVAYHHSGTIHLVVHADPPTLVELAADGSISGSIPLDLDDVHIAADGGGGVWLAGRDADGIPILSHRSLPLGAPDFVTPLSTESVDGVDAIARVPDGNVVTVLRSPETDDSRLVATSTSGAEAWTVTLDHGPLVARPGRGGLTFDEDGGAWVVLEAGLQTLAIVRLGPDGTTDWDVEIHAQP